MFWVKLHVFGKILLEIQEYHIPGVSTTPRSGGVKFNRALKSKIFSYAEDTISVRVQLIFAKLQADFL